MKNSRARIYAQNGSKGIDIYLVVNGTEHYLTTRRPNNHILAKLKCGTTLDELRRYKPKKSKAEQKYYHSISHLLKVTDDYINYELAA